MPCNLTVVEIVGRAVLVLMARVDGQTECGPQVGPTECDPRAVLRAVVLRAVVDDDLESWAQKKPGC